MFTSTSRARLQGRQRHMSYLTPTSSGVSTCTFFTSKASTFVLVKQFTYLPGSLDHLPYSRPSQNSSKSGMPLIIYKIQMYYAHTHTKSGFSEYLPGLSFLDLFNMPEGQLMPFQSDILVPKVRYFSTWTSFFDFLNMSAGQLMPSHISAARKQFQRRFFLHTSAYVSVRQHTSAYVS